MRLGHTHIQTVREYTTPTTYSGHDGQWQTTVTDGQSSSEFTFHHLTHIIKLVINKTYEVT